MAKSFSESFSPFSGLRLSDSPMIRRAFMFVTNCSIMCDSPASTRRVCGEMKSLTYYILLDCCNCKIRRGVTYQCSKYF